MRSLSTTARVEVVEGASRPGGVVELRSNPCGRVHRVHRALEAGQLGQGPRVLEDRLVRPRAADDEGPDEVGVLERRVHGGAGTHARANQDGGAGVEVRDQGRDVVALAERLERCRGLTVRPGVGGDDASAWCEVVDLVVPHPAVDVACMEQDDQRVASAGVEVVDVAAWDVELGHGWSFRQVCWCGLVRVAAGHRLELENDVGQDAHGRLEVLGGQRRGHAIDPRELCIVHVAVGRAALLGQGDEVGSLVTRIGSRLDVAELLGVVDDPLDALTGDPAVPDRAAGRSAGRRSGAPRAPHAWASSARGRRAAP